MREILFRGKQNEGRWVEGVYFKHDTVKVCFSSDDPKPRHLIIQDGFCDWGFEPPIRCVDVDPQTVGQFTGLTDKNGKKIFEGDIIRSDNGKQWAVSVVKFGEYVPKMFYRMLDMFSPGRKHLPSVGFYAKTVEKGEEMILFQSPCVTVIGNIHDNPELLEVTDNA